MIVASADRKSDTASLSVEGTLDDVIEEAKAIIMSIGSTLDYRDHDAYLKFGAALYNMVMDGDRLNALKDGIAEGHG